MTCWLCFSWYFAKQTDTAVAIYIACDGEEGDRVWCCLPFLSSAAGKIGIQGLRQVGRDPSVQLRLFISQHSVTGFPDLHSNLQQSEFCSTAQQPFRGAGMADLSDPSWLSRAGSFSF